MSDVEHKATMAAPTETVFGLIADTSLWPIHFQPTVHVEKLSQEGDTERIKIWAVAGDQVKSWISKRVLRADGRHISFRQEVSQAPIAQMSGAWVLSEVDGGTEVVLEHSYRAVEDDAESLAWIADVTDHNSRAELANLTALAENASSLHELSFTFEDTVVAAGSVSDVYDFLYRAQDWPDRLPHVSRMDISEPEPGVQIMEMDTVTVAGAKHTTKSVRVCFTDDRIVYKQVKVPALMSAHTGEWRIVPVDGGVAITSQHTVVIRPESIASVLSPAAGVADARVFAHNALSANSKITLELAKEFAEGRATASHASPC
jgi:aromatase